jgi:hypothetical protein
MAGLGLLEESLLGSAAMPNSSMRAETGNAGVAAAAAGSTDVHLVLYPVVGILQTESKSIHAVPD